jgi:transposase
MSRPPAFPAEQKTRIVLSILAGEITVAEAARQYKVSEQSVGTWKRQFLDAGRAGLTAKASGPTGATTREAALERENEQLKAALGEATVELRVWKKSAEYLAPSRTSR